MAMFLFTQYFGSYWDDVGENEVFDVISGGYQAVKEVFQYVQEWINGDELDANEIAEVTQSFALRVLVFTYTTVSWVIQYTCALLIYVFTDADTLHQAIEYVRPYKGNIVYKSLTSLVLYEKPISFDFNPIHWITKMTKIIFLGPLFRAPQEGSFLTGGKILGFVLVSFLIYRSFSNKRGLEFLHSFNAFNIIDAPVPPNKSSVERDPGNNNNSNSNNNNNASSNKYEGLIKWEAGLIRCSSDLRNDHLNLKITVNSNICSENPPVSYDEMIASSTASICKIVSDILTNTPLGSQELAFERSGNSTPRPNEEPEEERNTNHSEANLQSE